MRLYSIAIITLISFLVFTGAGVVMHATLSDTDSNLQVAQRVAINVMDITSLSAKEKDMPAPTPVPQVASAQIEACDPNAPYMITTISVVNYLKANGFNTKFADRVQLAADHGFHGYSGSSADNLRLMNYLKEDFANKNHCSA